MSTQRLKHKPRLVNKQDYGKLISQRKTLSTSWDVKKEGQLGGLVVLVKGRAQRRAQGRESSDRAGWEGRGGSAGLRDQLESG